MYRSQIVFKVAGATELIRYTIIENLSGSGFHVLHADFLRPANPSFGVDQAYLAKLTIELLVELDPAEIQWKPSPEAAILSHDEDFEN